MLVYGKNLQNEVKMALQILVSYCLSNEGVLT